MRESDSSVYRENEKLETKTCPDCGREIGDRRVCPYCGTDLGKRTSHKILAIFSAIALAFGLLYYVHAGRKGRHYVNIEQIDSDLNYGFVWVDGTVSGGPTYREHPSKRLEFSVYDGTGEISIRAYSEVAENLVKRNKVPGVGDEVEVFGMARVEEYGRRIDMQSHEKLELERTKPQESTVSEVRSNYFAGKKYQKVTVTGKLTELRKFAWMRLYTIEDLDTEEPLDVFASAGLPEITPGSYEDLKPYYVENLKLYSKLKVTGGVSEYQNSPQIAIRSYDDIKVVGQAKLPNVVPLSEVGKNLGDLIGARGKIVFSRGEANGYRFWLDNSDDNYPPISLWVWDSTYDLISDEVKDQFKRGALVKIYGTSTIYQDENQIKLASPPEIAILDNAGISTYEVGEIDVQNISSAYVGRFAKVRGEVKQLEKEGRQFTLKDPTGEIEVSLPSRVWTLMTEKPEQGDTANVAGRIDLTDENELVLRPGLPEDVGVSS